MKRLLFGMFAFGMYFGASAKELYDTVYNDVPYPQDYSVKYCATGNNPLRKVLCDRNGSIRILSDRGLLKPSGGQLLFPGTLIRDLSYSPLADRSIVDIALSGDQFVYLDKTSIFSNAWAGKLNCAHRMPHAAFFACGNDEKFLVSDGRQLSLVGNGAAQWSGTSTLPVVDIQADHKKNVFWVLTSGSLACISPSGKKLVTVYSGNGFTCFGVDGDSALIGTHDGYIAVSLRSGSRKGRLCRQLPATDLTAISRINGHWWFGSSQGAFMEKADDKFNFYSSQRWLPDDSVRSISAGKNNEVLILTSKGLAKICFEWMSLAQKASYYEQMVRLRHIRYGFYCDVSTLKNGNVSTAEMGPHDSDNLWTSMYLTGELFRWLVTHDEDARQNCLESLDAMERLFTLSGKPGLFGRCIERHGVVQYREEYRAGVENYWYPGYARTPSSWMPSADKEWDWRGSASSDQAVGQYFALTMIAQYMDDDVVRQRAVRMIDTLSSYILDNGLKLIDYNGRPSLWGIWAPEYVNRFPDMVGDKKLYSSNIISFLQTAYHFTGKEKYRSKAMELLYQYGYLKNLARPVSVIGPAPATADKWSRMLSGDWNNSDDEMYFLAYWGLYPYAFNDTLKAQYREAIRDHWQIKRPARDALWNFCYAMTGAKDFDLDESIWELKEMPMDLVSWSLHNSSRKDISFLPKPVRGQMIAEILPPDERPENKHNRNLFTLDSKSNGSFELGPGDLYLLPYWMGRYFGKISAPADH